MAHISRGTAPSGSLGSLGSTYDAIVAADAFFKVDLSAMNNSVVEGGAFLALDTDTNTLTVITAASGVEAGQVHPQHIHGFAQTGSTVPNSQVPSLAQDADNDGFVELGEGASTYGPVLLSLTSPPGGALSGFPAPADSDYVFVQSYDLDGMMFDPDSTVAGDEIPLSQLLTSANLDEREIVLHGLSVQAGHGVGTRGEVDGTGGYKAVLPIAAGQIERLSAEEVSYQLASARFDLGDQVVAFDIQGNAGQAYRLYEAAFNRDPDINGLSFWVEQLDEGTSLQVVARNFLQSDEFAASFGNPATLTDEAYLDVLYRNLLGRDGDDAGEKYWLDQLDAGASRASVLVSFSESTENMSQTSVEIMGGIMLNESVLV